jgi:carboxymethylenebutenolidase
MKRFHFNHLLLIILAGAIIHSCSQNVNKENDQKMEKQETNTLSPAQQELLEVWDAHVKGEFETKSTEHTLETMVPGAYVNHIPVLTGGVGLEEVGNFYSNHFIPKMPPSTELVAVSRTVGVDQIVDEMIFKFVHSLEMDWMLPGVAPTGKSVEVPLVAIIKFRNGKVAHEHIYWDQASVLVQIGLLDSKTLPVAGVESAQKVLDPSSVPSNTLIKRTLN